MHGVFSDYARYRDVLPEFFLSVRVRSVRGDVAVVEERINLGGDVLVVMAKHVTTPGLHEIFVIGGDAKGSRITERFTETADGTRIEVSADLRLGIGRVMSGPRYERGLGDIVDGFVRAAED